MFVTPQCEIVANLYWQFESNDIVSEDTKHNILKEVQFIYPY